METGQVQTGKDFCHLVHDRVEARKDSTERGHANASASWQILLSRFRGYVGRRRAWELEIGVDMTGAVRLTPFAVPAWRTARGHFGFWV